jgi:hypothetical protein
MGADSQEALPLSLPQPAFYVDPETGRMIPVVVIQAESSGDQHIVGVRFLDGGHGVCLLDEVLFVDEGDIGKWIATASRSAEAESGIVGSVMTNAQQSG